MTSSVARPTVRGLPGLDRCRVVGVVNVTPDSFSDGGRFGDSESAVRHGLGLLASGADLLDVGGESTRPGAEPVTVREEWARVGPVLHDLVAAGAVVSIDTMHAEVAEQALAAGARLVNDVSGGIADGRMLGLVAEAGVPFVCAHWRGPSAVMQQRAVYGDVVADVVSVLRGRLEACLAAGMAPEQVVLDPGLGFGKTAEHNWQLLNRLGELHALGRPLLVGASRKSFLGSLLATGDQPRAVGERDDATAAVSALAAVAGAWGVRVHAVRSSADAVRVASAWRSAGTGLG